MSGVGTPWCVPFDLLIKHNNNVDGFRKQDIKKIKKLFEEYHASILKIKKKS